jgi:hypothetical protein
MRRPDMVGHTNNPSYLGGVGWTIIVPGQPKAKSRRPYLKNKRKKGWDMDQVAEHLPSKHQVLNSNLSTTKTKAKQKEEMA